MTISGAVWFVIGGLIGAVFGALLAYNMIYAREYSEKIDYYDLDEVELNTPTYQDVFECYKDNEPF